ncbi:hypothetical protein CSKR_110257 [Clonorchis sinensis]|uniref:Uncharacterized protein n=1 Tax=Clonorchis sinensis TaxID=79923 RepID=A0A419PTG0_CLOSI|nr:hypothetical protein CSKR_110257 [Clonorchis sinensis]
MGCRRVFSKLVSSFLYEEKTLFGPPRRRIREFYQNPNWTEFVEYSHLHTNLVLKGDSNESSRIHCYV